MMRTYRIKETYPYQGRVAEHVAPEDVAETIQPWFPEVTDDLENAINELQGRLVRDEYHEDLAQYLSLVVERDD